MTSLDIGIMIFPVYKNRIWGPKKLSNLCKEHVIYKWISEMNNRKIDKGIN